MSPPESPYQGHTRFAVYAVCDSLNWAGLYSDLGGQTNAWHLREIVRRLCEQRQKISTSADEQQDHAAQRGRDASGQRRASCASLSRRLSAFFESTPDQDPKAAKFAVLSPGHTGFPKRAERSEGSDTAPIRNAPCFGVCAVVCDLSPKAERVYPLSRVKANVGHLCEKLKTRQETVGDKIYGGSFAGFFSSADSGGSQRTGKCMYIKARWNQGLQMRRSEQFCWQRKATLCPQKGRSLFRRVCPCVRSFSESRVCTRFRECKQTWAICERS